MQPCSREMQSQGGLNTLLNPAPPPPPQLSLQHDQHPHHHLHTNNPTHSHPQIHHTAHFDSSSTDDFLDHMFSSLPPPSPWSDLNPTDPNLPIAPNGAVPDGDAPDDVHFHLDEPAILAAKLRQHQISGGVPGSTAMAARAMMLQQQMLLARGAAGNDVVDGSSSSFKSSNLGGEGSSVQALFNGFAGSLHGNGQTSNHPQHFHLPQTAANFVAQAATNQAAATAAASGSSGGGGGGGSAPGQPKQRVRARRGQATDPHSIAERLRRERIAERMKALQELVPNANKTDKASMLDEIIDYVKFLQLQVKVLSMSRLGGAAAVAPLVADMPSSSEGGLGGGGSGADCAQTNANGGGTSNNDNSLTVTEHQVAKLMEEDMGTAMQYLQGKGLCLMPISLATAISAATCHSRVVPPPAFNGHHLNGDGPSSPSVSALTVQSGALVNGGGGGGADASANNKDAASVSKP